MEFFAKSGAPARQRTACAIVGIFEGKQLSPPAQELDTAAKGLITRLVKRGDIRGALGDTLLVTDAPGVACERILLVGLGAKNDFRAARYRKALATALAFLGRTGIKEALSYLARDTVKEGDAYFLARYGVEVARTSVYRFSKLKVKTRSPKPALAKLGFGMLTPADRNAAVRGALHGAAIADGMDLARDLGNMPANLCTPTHLAKTARKLAGGSRRLELRVLGEPEMKRLKMGALLSVTGGSAQAAKLIVLRYRGGKSNQAPVALVGKGITFDTGGISLKPPLGMEEMKFDMCGAAAVLGTIHAADRLALPITLVGVVPTCENMPGGHATKPGDIVTSMSGRTIEVINTDAEGRLILCDALTYAHRFKPRIAIDIATLTGACVIALGTHVTGLMSNDEQLSAELRNASERAMDRAWPLPIADEYMQQLKSSFADMSNVGGREGGAITAACFLSKFTEDLRWAHLDVAGTAWQSAGKNKGATGRPVPMLMEYLIGQT